MANYSNVFDYGSVAVYVRYRSSPDTPGPAGNSTLVAATDLDPSIGTCTVTGGVVTLTVTEYALSVLDGAFPEVVVVPAYNLGGFTGVRVRETQNSRSAIPTTYQAEIGTLVALGGTPATYQLGTITATADMGGAVGSRSATLGGLTLTNGQGLGVVLNRSSLEPA